MTNRTKPKSGPKKTRTPLTLHRLFGELSFWGTFVRWLFMTILAFLAVGTWAIIDDRLSYLLPNLLIVGMVSLMFLFYDALYVNMTRNAPMDKKWDKVALFGSEILFIILVALTSSVEVPQFVIKIVAMAPIFATLILLIRLVAGVLWGKKRSK